MSKDTLRVGVIGTSWWADLEHLPGLQSRGDVDVVALCGRNQERLDTLAAKYGIRQTFTDWKRMLARAGLDMLAILTPNNLHHPQAMSAFELGMHVICEQPLALNAAQAREMAARADASNCKTLTFFTPRSLAAAAHIKKLIQDGLLGQPHYVNAVHFSSSRLDPNLPREWRMVRAEAGAGTLGDIGSPLVDLVRWWLGNFTRVNAQWQTIVRERPGGKVETDDASSFLAQLACGAQGVFQTNKAVAGRGNYMRIELYGTKGALTLEAEPGYEPTWAGRVLAARAGEHGFKAVHLPASLANGLNTADEQANRNTAYRRLTDSFFEAIRTGGAVSPDFHDGAAVQAVIDAAAASAENGKWVTV